jgi:hypothetical protein
MRNEDPIYFRTYYSMLWRIINLTIPFLAVFLPTLYNSL